MGAGFSGFVEEGIGGGETPLMEPGLGDIPESCVALVLSYLDPPEICKLGQLNRVFRRASSADFVWESKLPENYQFLVKKLLNEENPESLAKKDIYARLCCPNGFDGGTKEVWMEKSSGEICISISWKGMKITGIDDRRYWNHIPTHESRFKKIAYLRQTWWLQVEGNLEFEFPRGTYGLYFRLRLGRSTTTKGIDRVHGWDIKPVRFQLSTSNGQHAMSDCYLSDETKGKWVNYHVGDFVVDDRNPIPLPTKIKFSMAQIDCTHTKGGLCLDSVLILGRKFMV